MKISIAEAKNRLPELVRLAEGGDEVVITRHGRPVARLAPAAPSRRRVRFGAMKDRVRLAPGWDAPIDEAELLGRKT